MQLQDLNRAPLVPDFKEPKELRDTQENEAAHPVIKAHEGSLLSLKSDWTEDWAHGRD